jgi:hypothetical protein
MIMHACVRQDEAAATALEEREMSQGEGAQLYCNVMRSDAL